MPERHQSRTVRGREPGARAWTALAGWDRNDYRIRVAGGKVLFSLGLEVLEGERGARLNAAYGAMNAFLGAGLLVVAVKGDDPASALAEAYEDVEINAAPAVKE